MEQKFNTREQLLTHAAHLIMDEIVLPEVAQLGITLPHATPQFRISVGFARGVKPSAKYSILGVCHPRSHSTDQHNEVFISPECDDLPQILATLVHEQIHAALDCQDGHRGRFTKIARACGLIGRLSATSPDAELADALQFWIDTELGAYPASKMLPISARPKQTTRMLKLTCSACGFTARLSRRWAVDITCDSTCPACGCTDTLAV